ARFNSDGTLDTSFIPSFSLGGVVETILIQPNGAILIGGQFDSINGTPRHNLARLLPTGVLDGTFNPGLGPDAPVKCLALGPGEKILVGGAFTNFAGAVRPGIVRLQTNAVMDMSFDPGAGTTNPCDPDPLEVDALSVDASGNVAL